MVRTAPTDENASVSSVKFSPLTQASESREFNPGGVSGASRLTALGEMTLGIGTTLRTFWLS
jgi:hypothetical protein